MPDALFFRIAPLKVSKYSIIFLNNGDSNEGQLSSQFTRLPIIKRVQIRFQQSNRLFAITELNPHKKKTQFIN
jgi:hypothetical protein